MLAVPSPERRKLEIDEEPLRWWARQYEAVPLPDSPGEIGRPFPGFGRDLSMSAYGSVDAFGQAMKVVDQGVKSSILVGRSLQLPTRTIGFACPPSDPAGPIRVRWMSQDDDSGKQRDPSTQPICGWVLPIGWDNSLIIYDAHGKGARRNTMDR